MKNCKGFAHNFPLFHISLLKSNNYNNNDIISYDRSHSITNTTTNGY